MTMLPSPNMSGPFIIAVSGSRGITARELVWDLLDAEWAYYTTTGFDVQVRLGDAAGVDHLALGWARARGVPRTIYFADRAGYVAWEQSWPLLLSDSADIEVAHLASDWDRDGKSAGPARNAAMLGILEPKYRPLADLLVAVWDGSSPGTRNCMATARNCGVFIHQYGGGAAVQFKVAGPRDAELVEWRGELAGA